MRRALLALPLLLAACAAQGQISDIGAGYQRIRQPIAVRSHVGDVRIATIRQAEAYCKKQDGSAIDIRREDILSEKDYTYQLDFRCVRGKSLNPFTLPEPIAVNPVPTQK